MSCPDCNCESIEVKWNEVPSHVGYCPKCDMIFLLDGDETIIVREELSEGLTEDVPDLALGKTVFVINKEHPYFLERGAIIAKDHKHYRIKFVSLTENLNNKCLWVPDHWVEEVPKELKSIR